MTWKPWLMVLCGGLLLVTPLLARADPGGPGGASSSPWDKPEEKQASPQQVQAEYEKGYGYLKAGDYKKAIKSFESVVKENPSHAMAYNNMGYSYRKLKQYDKAISLYEKALVIDPNLAEAHEYIGEAYLEMGKIAEAKKHLTILEKLDPKIAEELREEIARYDKRSSAPSPRGRGDGNTQLPTAADSATSSPQNSS